MPSVPLPAHLSQKHLWWTVVLSPVAGPPGPGAERGGRAPAHLPEGIPAASVLPLCASSSAPNLPTAFPTA